MKVNHNLEPFYDKNSEILILGSIPSVKSRELGFYYMHPQTRFWRILEKVYEEPLPVTIEEKKEFLKKHKIALWDVLSSCTARLRLLCRSGAENAGGWQQHSSHCPFLPPP